MNAFIIMAILFNPYTNTVVGSSYVGDTGYVDLDTCITAVQALSTTNPENPDSNFNVTIYECTSPGTINNPSVF